MRSRPSDKPMSETLTPASAAGFARDWIDAWNSRGLERILSHYSAEIDFASPFVRPLLGGASDYIRGIAALREYFARALKAYPDLRFDLQGVYFGARSVVLQYQSVSNRSAAEMMEFDDAGLICRVRAHYFLAEDAEPSSEPSR